MPMINHNRQSKIIKVFLASSEELENDRNAFGNFVRRLDDIYEKRGTRIKLFEWEDYDAAYNDKRKQDEYNEKARISDLFLALFYKKAGKFTIEEFNVATGEFRHTGIKPKTYVYCRDLQEGENETEDLQKFKKYLSEELGYYWIRYNNKDSMQLHFIMQLQINDNSRLNNINVENGDVVFEGAVIAHMNNLHFVAYNKDYQQKNIELLDLQSMIEKAWLCTKKYPDDDDLKCEYQQLKDKENKLKAELTQHQNLLLNTAKRIATLQGEAITDRLRRAIEAFERGDIKEANIILDEAEKDGDYRFAIFDRKEELREKEICNIHIDIRSLMMQTTTIMADVDIPIQLRIDKTNELYKKADYRASRTGYEKEKHFDLLSDYANFLYVYGLYSKAESVYMRLIPFAEELYGTENEITITTYNNMGKVYREMANYSKALECYFKAREVLELNPEKAEYLNAITYRNIGLVYFDRGNYSKALENYLKAVEIQEKVFGVNHIETASSYNNIGSVYRGQGDGIKALEFYRKALEIREKFLSEDSPVLSNTFNNIGCTYYNLEDYTKSEEYHLKALEIREKSLGMYHPYTGQTYNNLGTVYWRQKTYSKALTFFKKALAIQEKALGTFNPFVAIDYNNIGMVYREQGDCSKALEFFIKALEIEECVHGLNHTNTAIINNNIGKTYYCLKEYEKSLEYFTKALNICKKNPELLHLDTQEIQEWIAKVKTAME